MYCIKLMNFIKDPILIIAAIVLFVTACNKDKVDYEQPFIKVNPSTLNVESAASEQIISVNSNRDWTVEIISDAETSWISSNLKQGEAGTVELKLSILSTVSTFMYCLGISTITLPSAPVSTLGVPSSLKLLLSGFK